MASLGEDLRRERNRHGWSLKDVEQVLHIRSAYLEAIETDHFTLIPGTVYTKGFIRNYANLLGLDGQKYVNRYKELIGEEIIIKVRPSERVRKKKSEDKKKETLPTEPPVRLTYEGRRRQRQKTIDQERIAAGIIILTAFILFIWLFLF